MSNHPHNKYRACRICGAKVKPNVRFCAPCHRARKARRAVTEGIASCITKYADEAFIDEVARRVNA